MQSYYQASKPFTQLYVPELGKMRQPGQIYSQQRFVHLRRSVSRPFGRCERQTCGDNTLELRVRTDDMRNIKTGFKKEHVFRRQRVRRIEKATDQVRRMK